MPATTAKRGPGRPRKNPVAEESQKKRGRPPKNGQAETVGVKRRKTTGAAAILHSFITEDLKKSLLRAASNSEHSIRAELEKALANYYESAKGRKSLSNGKH